MFLVYPVFSAVRAGSGLKSGLGLGRRGLVLPRVGLALRPVLRGFFPPAVIKRVLWLRYVIWDVANFTQ
jgi:hypothetical protein